LVLDGLPPVLEREIVLDLFKFDLDKLIDFGRFHRLPVDSGFFYPKRQNGLIIVG
jgi:hypothetical protein